MKTKHILSAIIFTLVLLGCQEEDFTYQGPQYYEFSAYEKGQSLMGSIIEKENNVIGLDSICVQIIKPANNDIVVEYEIVEEIFYIKDKGKYVTQIPDGMSKDKVEIVQSSANYGVDYTVKSVEGSQFSESTKTGTLTIKKGEYMGYITVDMKIKSGNMFFVVLKDSHDAKANKPTSILKYIMSPDKTFYLDESFSESLPDSWSIIDKDGDGFNWVWHKGAMTSDSYLDDEGAVFPENYLISPKFTISKREKNVVLEYNIAAGGRGAYEEQYRIIVSENPITFDNCRDAEIIRDWTVLTDEHKSKNFVKESVDMQNYIGKTVYIGFLHGNCTDEYYILLKDVVVYGY